MFGYINVNGRELSEDNKQIYQSYYCGLCHALKDFCGKRGQALLNYDMTFLIVLLTGLYEPETSRRGEPQQRTEEDDGGCQTENGKVIPC